MKFFLIVPFETEGLLLKNNDESDCTYIEDFLEWHAAHMTLQLEDYKKNRHHCAGG